MFVTLVAFLLLGSGTVQLPDWDNHAGPLMAVGGRQPVAVSPANESKLQSDSPTRLRSVDKYAFAAGMMLGAVTWRLVWYSEGDSAEFLPPGNGVKLDSALQSLRFSARRQFASTLERFLQRVSREPASVDEAARTDSMSALQQPLVEFLTDSIDVQASETFRIGLCLASMNLWITKVFGYEEEFAPNDVVLYDVPKEELSTLTDHATRMYPVEVAGTLRRIVQGQVRRPTDRMRITSEIASICVHFGLVSKP